MTSSPPSTDRFATLVSVILLLIVVAVLYFLKDVFVPVALALLSSAFCSRPFGDALRALAAAAHPGGDRWPSGWRAR